jgi:hypothetical protein
MDQLSFMRAGSNVSYFLFGVIDFPILIIYKGPPLKDRKLPWDF